MDDLRRASEGRRACALSDLFTKPGFFETDFRFFDFGGEAASLEPFLGLYECRLRAFHINVFSLLGDLGHDGHFSRCDFCVTPEDRHMAGLIPDTIAQFPNAQGRKKMAMPWQDAELTF